MLQKNIIMGESAMKKIILLITVVCMMGLIGCSTKDEGDKWDCSVAAAEDNTAEDYIITYSEEEINLMVYEGERSEVY